jgi:hypothetical protein
MSAICAGAQITDVSQLRGIVTVMMIAEMGLMNHRSTASLKVGPASVICSPVIMGTAFLVSTFVMVIMIVLTIRMKMRGISAVSKSFNHRFFLFEHCQYVFIVPTLQFFILLR